MTPGTTHPSTAVRSVKSNSYSFKPGTERTGILTVLGKGALISVLLCLPCVGQPAPHAHAANIPRYLGALIKKAASPLRLL